MSVPIRTIRHREQEVASHPLTFVLTATMYELIKKKIKSYKEQLWPGQKEKKNRFLFKPTFVLAGIVLAHVCSNYAFATAFLQISTDLFSESFCAVAFST